MKAVNPNSGAENTEQRAQPTPSQGAPSGLRAAVLGPGSLTAHPLAFPSSLPHGQQEAGPPHHTLTHPRPPVFSSGCSALSWAGGWG